MEQFVGHGAVWCSPGRRVMQIPSRRNGRHSQTPILSVWWPLLGAWQIALGCFFYDFSSWVMTAAGGAVIYMVCSITSERIDRNL